MPTPIEVLIVDDSAFMRKAISMMLERASDIAVVDTAVDGEEGVEKAVALEPDVVTMDVEMPNVDGITAVRRIMETAPRPILMLSSLTEDGAEVTLKAMRAGAADFIPKGHAHTSLQIKDVEEELVEKVRALAHSESRLFRKEGKRTETETPAPSDTAPTPPAQAASQTISDEATPELIAIGVSTGGPMALQHVVPALPANLPVPVVITQHMPPRFTRSLAERLDGLSALDVTEAADGTPLRAGQVVVAAGGRHLTVHRRGSSLRIRTPKEPDDPAHCPSVNVMFRSACDACGGKMLAVVMTGMGKDGLQGAQQVKKEGGRVIAQDEPSSVVYGMPRAVVEAGVTDAVVPLDGLPEAIGDAVGAVAPS